MMLSERAAYAPRDAPPRALRTCAIILILSLADAAQHFLLRRAFVERHASAAPRYHAASAAAPMRDYRHFSFICWLSFHFFR